MKAKPTDRLRVALDEIRALRADPASEATIAALRQALAKPSCHVVAAAARHAGEHRLTGLAEALVTAYARFEGASIKDDPGCTAKLALVTALAALDHPDERPLLHAVGHVQHEGPDGTDTATPLRSTAMITLANLSYPRVPVLAAEMLADPEARCRGAAARALRGWGDPVLGEALLRLRLRAREADPDALSDMLDAILGLRGADGVPYVAALLDQPSGELAAVALGTSRLPAALPALTAFYAREPASRKVVALAIGLLRTPDALAFLLGVVASGTPTEGRAALEALAVFATDRVAAERIRAAAEAAGLQ